MVPKTKIRSMIKLLNVFNDFFVSLPIDDDEDDLSIEQSSLDNLKRAKLNNISAKLEQNLTKITTKQPSRRQSIDNNLMEIVSHEPHTRNEASSSLLDEQRQKDEDRWDKFIECLLFFCCVG